MSGGLDADPGMLYGSNLIVRGARAHPDSNIGSFKNVAGLRRESVVWPDFPFLRVAFAILDEDPIDYDKLKEEEVVRLQNSSRWSNHLRQLQGVLTEPVRFVDSLGLSEEEARLKMAGEEALARRICGKYTSVWKDVEPPPPIARVIFDLRRLNAVCNDKNVPFTVLGAPQMIEEMRLVPTERGMFVIVHADLVNFYYQIGVGDNLSNRMLLLWGDVFIRSKVLCMGFCKSCGIAMALCLALIILQESGEAELGIPSDLRSSASAPGCVRLTNGGIIFLVYDSIMILCPRKDASLWHKKLDRVFTKAGLMFKYLSVAAPGEVVNYCGMEAKSDREGLKWRVAGSSLSTWKILRRAVLRRSPRSLFKVTGYLRFSMSVMGEPRWRLGRVSKAQSKLGKVVDWDVVCIDQNDLDIAWNLFDELVAVWESVAGWRHRQSHVPKVAPEQPLFIVVAVDATPWTWAVDVLVDANVVKGGSKKGRFAAEKPIAEAEAKGSLEGIVIAKNFNAPVIVVCNDNRPVGRGFWKGYSAQDELDGYIKKGVPHLEGKVYVGVDVPSKENFADIGTREEKDYSPGEVAFRRQRTFERAMCAAEKWRKTGLDYFGREDIELDDSDLTVPEYDSGDE